MRNRLRGFTLVELLVVIGIIALLISILLPTLNKARESANRAACASNLHQIGMAVMQYDMQFKRLPGPCIPCVLDPDATNLAQLNTFYGGDPSGNGVPSKVFSALLSKQLKSGAVWFCPSATILRTTATPIGGTYAGKILGYCYKINNQSTTTPAYFFGSWNSGDIPSALGGSATQTQRDFSGADKALAKRIFSIRNAAASTATVQAPKIPASEIWMISDIDGRNFPDSATTTFGISSKSITDLDARPYQPVHFSKKRGRNYVYFDGHAEYVYLDMEPANS